MRDYAVVDLETDTLDPRALGAGVVATAITTPSCVTTVHRGAVWPGAKMLVGHNIKFDLRYLRHFLPDEFETWRRSGGRVYDTLLAEFMLGGQLRPLRELGLDAVAARRGLPLKPSAVAEQIKNGVRPSAIPWDELVEYARHDADTTHALALSQLALLRANPKLRRLIRRHCDALLLTLDAEAFGLPCDAGVLQDASAWWAQRVADTRAALRGVIERYMPHVEANENSPLQLANALYGGEYTFDAKEPVTRPDGSVVVYKTGPRAGQPKLRRVERALSTPGAGFTAVTRSTNALTLSQLAPHTDEQRTLLALLADSRGASKILSTYCLPWQAALTAGRIHSEFMHANTRTGRLASSHPNIQNVPKNAKYPCDAANLRRAVVAPDGWALLEVDFKAVEVRFLAQLSDDAVMIAELNDGRDPHDDNAARLFGAGFTPHQRDIVKRFSFALQYGAGAATLARSNGVSRTLASKFIEQYNKKYQGVAEFFDRTHADVLRSRRRRENGVVAGEFASVSGRRLLFPDAVSRHGPAGPSPTETRNYPIQSIATGDFALIQTTRLWEHLRERGDVQVVNLIHDSVLFAVRRTVVDEVAAIAHSVLANTTDVFAEWGITPVVKFTVDVKVGPNWAEMTSLNQSRVTTCQQSLA